MQYIILCCETYDITLGLSCVTLIFNKIIKMNFFDFTVVRRLRSSMNGLKISFLFFWNFRTKTKLSHSSFKYTFEWNLFFNKNLLIKSRILGTVHETEREDGGRDRVTEVVEDGDLDHGRPDETEAAVQDWETTGTAVEEAAMMTTNFDADHVMLWVQNTKINT